MNYYQPQKPSFIDSISVISSAICNLNCSFCYLNKNESYKIFNEEVHKAWQDGSYLDNILKTVINFPASPEKVKIIQLWGGETLLNIDDITKNLSKFYYYFPQIEEWKVSTNWVINIDNFYNFLCELDKIAPKKVIFSLQISIDGPEGIYTEQGHNGKWEIYNKNFDKFFNLINNTFFKNLCINLTINATVAENIYYEQFGDYNNMKNYMEYMYNFSKYLEKNCINKALNYCSYVVFPGMSLPYYDSVEDGQKLANIFALWDRVKAENFPDIDKYFCFYYGMNDFGLNKAYNLPNIECSELKNSVTINPDGSICECNGSFIDHLDIYKKELEEKGLDKELKVSKLRDKINYNPGKMTKEEIEKHDWYIKYGYKNNTSTYLMAMFAVCKELLKCGQISKEYEDDDLLLKHLVALSTLISCTRENLKETGVPYLIAASCFRRYLNGAMDYIYNNNVLKLKHYNNFDYN